MKLSLIAAVSENNVIGAGLDIPWHAKGEQLLFKAMTFNKWLLVGRKTFESMGILENRKYAVVTRQNIISDQEGVLFFPSIDQALTDIAGRTSHLFVCGGGQIYHNLIDRVDEIHLSTIHCQVEGDVFFPALPSGFKKIFAQEFQSNINYTYEIWKQGSPIS